MATEEGPELVVCDTSFIALTERAERKPEVVAHWPADEVARIEASVLAISVISLAEIRAGRLYAGWGERRAAAQEERLAGLVWIPLDTQIVDEWAELTAHGLRNGWRVKDNDLWIAATATAKDLTLVSCDRGFQSVPGLDWIYLPADPTSKAV